MYLTGNAVLIAGYWRFSHYEESLADGFARHGISCVSIPYPALVRNGFTRRLEDGLLLGFGVWRANWVLFWRVVRDPGCTLLLYNAVYVWPITILFCKLIRKELFVVLYSNDNPFNGKRIWRKWRNYIQTISISDLVLYYRPSDRNNIRALTSGLVLPLEAYYDHRQCPEGRTRASFRYDVVFIGHFENDGRLEVLEELVSQGLRVGLFGDAFSWRAAGSRIIDTNHVMPVYGSEYFTTLRESKVALVFLSSYNEDVYTRRCYEIPASGALMLAPWTSFLAKRFVENKEAVFYRHRRGLIDAIKYYTSHEVERESIAIAGALRAKVDDHSGVGRAGQILQYLATISHGSERVI